jgi:hypothetical protein
LDNEEALPRAVGNTMDKPIQTSDGSTDTYFGPKSPATGRNWIATVPRRGRFTLLRPSSKDEVISEGLEFSSPRWKRVLGLNSRRQSLLTNCEVIAMSAFVLVESRSYDIGEKLSPADSLPSGGYRSKAKITLFFIYGSRIFDDLNLS